MKEFCNSLMKLNSDAPYGEDFSPVLLALFIRESGYDNDKQYSLSDYLIYIFRFYCDNELIRKRHYNKMINNIYNYYPSDFLQYTNSVLHHVAEKTGLICLARDTFFLANCPENADNYQHVINNIINILVSKYLGPEYCDYSSNIDERDCPLDTIFNNKSRVFNRAMEKINYCFICDENNINNLKAVKLSDKCKYLDNNYIVLCDQHAELFLNKRMIIKKNGYPYIDGERKYQHLEISALKHIREYLP